MLALVPRARIVALSADAEQPYAYLRDEAVGIPQLQARPEQILLARPDLVVRSYGGGPRIEALLDRLDVPVLSIGWIDTLEDIRDNIRQVGDGLGNPTEAALMLENFDRRMHALRERSVAQHSPRPTALYVTPGGVTGGSGTLVNDMLDAAGFDNFARRTGWHTLPLERLAYEQPDLLVTASFVSTMHPWSSARHPLIRQQLSTLPTVAIPGAWTACGGWFLLDAVEALAQWSR